ncbi:unnamed protein product [Anisakis simplex]|uniref:Uncharacterized protein n=1 Tax=Anisakis simplex TaxID=6269 RepID=A0A0M3J0D3_ANISI|nr:unnamed protein product [Anisakis simplex]
MMPLADMPPPRRQSVVANLFARRQTVANVQGIPTFPRSRAMSTAAALSTVPAVFSVEADFQKSKSVDAQIEEEKSQNPVLRKLRRFSFLPTREPASDMTRRSSVSPQQFAAGSVHINRLFIFSSLTAFRF